MEKLEAEMLESPTWKHRKDEIAPEPFDDDDFGGMLSKNLKKIKNKGSKKKNNQNQMQ